MTPLAATTTTGLTPAQFVEISALVKSLCGINLHDGKQELMRARLTKRLRALGLGDFRDYLELLRADPTGAELTAMLDVLSTNLTSFFREPAHYDFLLQEVVPALRSKAQGPGRLRLWSAGCATGEEPYSILIRLWEGLADAAAWDLRVLATDLSTRVLAKARAGVYGPERLREVPADLITRHFAAANGGYRVRDHLRQGVRFARLNLIDPWPMRGSLDAVFCRNVMIYFDKPTQGELVRRFHGMLRPGGILFIGHSESLTGIEHEFAYMRPTIYQRA